MDGAQFMKQERWIRRHIDRQRETDSHTIDRNSIGTQTNRRTDNYADNYIDTQRYRAMGRQTDRHTDIYAGSPAARDA